MKLVAKTRMIISSRFSGLSNIVADNLGYKFNKMRKAYSGKIRNGKSFSLPDFIMLTNPQTSNPHKVSPPSFRLV